MAAVPENGVNAGRTGRPMRQSPSKKYNGYNEPGIDPTNERGQTPSEIFGLSTPMTTGARGSSGAGMGDPGDVTMQHGQLDSGLAQVSGSEITSTGAPGSMGATLGGNGGTSVTYTDPYGFQGGVNRSVTVTGKIDGPGDWTQFGDGSGFTGATLPSLVNARPVSSGAGEGHVRGAGKGL